MSQIPEAVAINLQTPRWIIVFAALAALLLAVGASISLLAPQQLVTPGVEINSAAQTYAGYTFSRDLGLFIVLCVGLIKRSRSIMTVMMGLWGGSSGRQTTAGRASAATKSWKAWPCPFTGRESPHLQCGDHGVG